jgi:hypothetical protein
MAALSRRAQSIAFRLDDEHRSRISDCVRKDSIQLTYQGIVRFAHNIEILIVTFVKAKGNTTGSYRQARNALRDLWRLSHQADDDISVRLPRARLQCLPKLALDYLDMRARLTSPELFDSVDGGFLTWAKDADATRLVEMIRIHSGVGARLVSRSRGRGKRSRARLEPVIFGQARGDGGGVNTGGRPSQDARDTLVMHLTVSPPALSRCRAVATTLVSATWCTPCSSGSTSLPRTRRSDAIGMKLRRAGPDPRSRHLFELASGFCQYLRVGDARLSVQCTVMSPILRRARNRIAVPRQT